ncbi:oligopeptidase A [Candidatus Steffania adelgidicola]|uniref:oligopeptidase A n=1 Tax=Candidatus Steffania adelgidicola TaxID=1076626 RepID=UPI001D025935|nr:oligopeptidase A [Candidatus Steffania adelgidicola]UDG79642.1 Oligopeptidase A [Candidatus Steffania adelgidicola]
MNNPLLTAFTLPPFSAIRPEHILPAIKVVLEDSRCAIEKVIAQPAPFFWENLCQPLAEAGDRLNRIWSPISHLNSVKNSQKLREAYEECLPLLSAYSTWVGQNRSLYQAYKNLHSGPYYGQLSVAQKKTVENALRDFKLSGIELTAKKQQRYGQIVARLSELSSLYSNNVLDATMGWSKLITDKHTLVGIPESQLASMQAQAKMRQQKGWLLTLDIPSYVSVLTYCDSASLREELYRAYNTRASDQGPDAGKWDNGPIMSEMLMLRYEVAQLLGFDSYADKSLATKMAQNTNQVIDFLNDLSIRVRPHGECELAKLCAFSQRYFARDTLEPWDIAYYSEKQKKHLFSIDDEQLRPYFPEKRVISALFEVVNRIYGITAKERFDVEIWHPEVRFFDLFDECGEVCGSFYLDLYIRDNKRAGAWMDECMGKMLKSDGELQKPVAYLTCNFNRPIGDKPALFLHDEVITLFHEFGHGLHHILTRIDTPGVAGISGVPWDAVELPSQFMENYCWKSEALLFISGHYETAESLPDNLLKHLLEAKNYQAAVFILRQVELALFDFCIHVEYQPECGARVLEILEKVQTQVAVMPSVSWRRFPNTFSHIFAGGYAAGYYSYLWADVLAADVWSYFEEVGIFNRDAGRAFLNTILSRGGSESPMVLCIRFLGRKPQLNAMLRHYGIQES